LSFGFSFGVFLVGGSSSFFVDISNDFNIVSLSFFLSIDNICSNSYSLFKNSSVAIWSNSFWFFLSKRLLVVVMVVLNGFYLIH